VARFAAGDGAACAEVVRLFAPRVRALLVRLVGSRHDADDLCQEVFVRAWKRRAQYDGRGSFEGWLLRSAVHAARDHARRRRPTEVLDADGPGSLRLGPEGAAASSEFHRALVRALAALPVRWREALVLRVLEERSYEETALILGLVPGSVRILVMKARRRLEELLGEHLDGGVS
jgi:RNA polymerase sigma-70 factor (ECF subfamily)